MHQHTFVVLAYRESPYLEACLQSLLSQTVPSPIIISTSTPSDWLSEIGARYKLPIKVREGEQSIADDWNFALAMADTSLVTLAHHDDIYQPRFTEQALAAAEKHPDLLLSFTNMDLLIEGQRINRTLNRSIQRLLLWPYLFKGSLRSSFLRRLTLAFGNPVSCPSVTYQLKNLERLNNGFCFDRTYPNNLDWEAWIRLAKQPGTFAYNREILLSHRFHTGSATSASLAAQHRHSDDRRIFDLLWPKPFSGVFAALYALAYRSRHG